ncbi:MAG TPA: amidase [Actinomycetes bacterium]|nr:amidase [Actinomycetes bacterium]
MAVRRPAPEDLQAIARQFHFTIPDERLPAFQALVEGFLAPYDRLEQLQRPAPAPRWPRDGGAAPLPAENPLGAWAWRVRVEGAPDGPLHGRTVAIKDNVAVAGVPMRNGTDLLDGYVPDEDATVVERVLDAGGTILGKAVCESLCFPGGSHTADSGPVRNPYDPTRSTGGSSTGSAALVASGAVDLAIGGDQGGSVRIPSCWSGIYGLKPTWGLVPYTGAFPIEASLDHLGPMARSSRDVALLLSVLAGPDGLDPRQHAGLRPADYLAAVGGDVAGLRLAVVREGFGHQGLSEPDVDEAVMGAARAFERLGAKVEEVSIPWHRDAMAVWNAIAVEGATAIMVAGESMAYGAKGRYATDLVDAFGAGRRARGDRLSETVKLTVLAGRWMAEAHHGRWYAAAQNLAHAATAAYDEALAAHDLLLMPTLPMKATPLPADDAPVEEYVARALEMIPNTAPFDVTGHPAMNVPCAMSAGLPVGMMLVGRHGDEPTILRAADAFEREVFQPPPPAPTPAPAPAGR